METTRITALLDALTRAHEAEPDARRATRLLRLTLQLSEAYTDLLDAIDDAEDAIRRQAADAKEQAQ